MSVRGIAPEDTRAVHDWFGLSYAHYLVLPRSLLQEMPADWQQKMVALLNEMHEAFDDAADYDVRRRAPNGQYAHDPLSNYRHPDRAYIDGLRS